jgi:hypothetical protein
MNEHDVTTCRLCEPAPPGAFCRHWKHEAKASYWHLVADGPDLMARLPRQAHFCTILAYRLDEEARTVTYRGPLYWEFDAPDPAHALNDLRRCVQILEVEYSCSLETLHLWHSGGRGFHVTMPPRVLGAEAGHPLLPRLFAALLQRLFPPQVAPTLDRAVYSAGKGRMWRLPNRRRADTGRYKVPLAIREVLHKPYADLEALTLRPRKGVFWPSDADLSPCPGLVPLYHEVVATLERSTARAEADAHRSGRHKGVYRDASGVLFHAFQARGWIEKELSPGKWSVTCPWAAEHTKGTPGDSSTVLFAPRLGETLGWFHCSHMHCEGRTFEDVLARFSADERLQARLAGGLRTITAAELIAQGYRTVDAAEVPSWRR